ncbi:glutamyl-tRNA synthetase [Pluteus cervinus]|uniref:Glutamyl-tRNA synthetase n=1 Tax=Pluteus cervinus TaxID=181527 RepID=A0ACD3BA65_9AGAR|nr:glutamyl-tRNA synthetase [Pluteus cervinus]
MVLLRFAPSPTGPLHLGGLRMALYNYLYAKKSGGKWIMRIEDTDAARYVPGAVEGIRKALDWAGVHYDYGPGNEGPHAPYFQSERLDLYHTHAAKLLDSGHAYRCFCSQDTLAATREKLARSGSNLTYDKRCLHLTEEEVARKVRAGEKSIVRWNDSVSLDVEPTSDIVFGPLKDAHASLATDPVLLKSDRFPTYHLASVVDDHAMGITHVLRGEEWLTSLPLHLDLYSALRLQAPKFAHIPLLLNPDGTKMSKRNGDVQVVDYIRRGWEPSAINNWLALAGWGARHDVDSSRLLKEAPDSTTIMTMDELVEEFDLSALTHRSSVLDPAKLEYLNKHHLMRIWSTPEGLQDLAQRAHDHVKAAFSSSQYTSLDYIKNAILTLEGRLTNVQDIPKLAPFFFVDPDLSSPEAKVMIKKITLEQRAQVLQAVTDLLATKKDSWSSLNFLGLLHEERGRLGVPSKVYMTVLRHALTGMKDGPAVADIMRVIGPERTLARLK